MVKKASAQSQKMQEKPVKERAIEAALTLASSMPWDMVTLSDIAAEADMSLAELSDYFDDKADILVAFERGIDRRMLEEAGSLSPDETPRDRLFDILMARFDILGENREAALSILKALRVDPKQVVIGFPHLGRSMSWALESAGIETTGIKGAVRVAGITGIYLNTLRIWIDDESADLSKTMAALDKGLSRAEKLASNFML
jgi:ubiquinone biosynthesis protein COQ9